MIFVYIPHSASMGRLCPPKPPWVKIISLLFVNFEDVWLCCVCLKPAPLPDADNKGEK